MGKKNAVADRLSRPCLEKPNTETEQYLETTETPETVEVVTHETSPAKINIMYNDVQFSRDSLIKLQKADPSLKVVREKLENNQKVVFPQQTSLVTGSICIV